jgi:Rrf2 family protein
MISKTGIYGIRAMLALAQLPEDEYAGAPRIAELVQVPPSYLSKLLQILARAGLVRSQRGVSGGFRLARGPAEISLYDIVKPLEPIERWSGCFLGNSECSEESACAIHDRWKRVQQTYLGMLRRSTLAELARREPLTSEQLETVLGA